MDKIWKDRLESNEIPIDERPHLHSEVRMCYGLTHANQEAFLSGFHPGQMSMYTFYLDRFDFINFKKNIMTSSCSLCSLRTFGASTSEENAVRLVEHVFSDPEKAKLIHTLILENDRWIPAILAVAKKCPKLSRIVITKEVNSYPSMVRAFCKNQHYVEELVRPSDLHSNCNMTIEVESLIPEFRQKVRVVEYAEDNLPYTQAPSKRHAQDCEDDPPLGSLFSFSHLSGCELPFISHTNKCRFWGITKDQIYLCNTLAVREEEEKDQARSANSPLQNQEQQQGEQEEEEHSGFESMEHPPSDRSARLVMHFLKYVVTPDIHEVCQEVCGHGESAEQKKTLNCWNTRFTTFFTRRILELASDNGSTVQELTTAFNTIVDMIHVAVFLDIPSLKCFCRVAIGIIFQRFPEE